MIFALCLVHCGRSNLHSERRSHATGIDRSVDRLSVRRISIIVVLAILGGSTKFITSQSAQLDEISLQHVNDLAHHIRQGNAWLAKSAGGNNTAALSYAAFEFRFAIERLAVHYWATLLGRKPEADDLKDTDSFKRVEQRIYELAGHQKAINGHFEFMRIVHAALKIDFSLHTPQIGKLSRYWHDCSELCHVGWPLACSVKEVRDAAFSSLNEIAGELFAHAGSLGWPIIEDTTFNNLRDQFIRGDASSGDVLAHIERTGLWAQIELPNGTSRVVGEAVVALRVVSAA